MSKTETPPAPPPNAAPPPGETPPPADPPGETPPAAVVPMPAAPSFMAELLAADGIIDDEPGAVPPARRSNAAAETIAYFDAIVNTAPHDKDRKMFVTEKKHCAGLAHRLGRAVTRAKLKDVFVVGSAQETRPTNPRNGQWYVYLRPKSQATATPTAPATEPAAPTDEKAAS